MPPPRDDDEWHEYDLAGRRIKALFLVPDPRFLVMEHRAVRHIAMIDAVTGVIILNKRRSREFFDSLVPNARWFATRNHGMPSRLARIPEWCAPFRQQLLNKPRP